MYKKFIWPILLVTSITLIFVFIVGFVISIDISRGSSGETVENNEIVMESTTQNTIEDTNESTIEAENHIDTKSILILGDSIGFGFGDDPDLGIGKRYISLLDPEGTKDITLTNLSVPGYEAGDLLTLVSAKENEGALTDIDLIILSIGGNDLNRIDYSDAVTLEAEYTRTLTQYLQILRQTIDLIRVRSPRAQLAIIGLYDPYQEEDNQQTRLLLQWNYETQRMASTDYKMAYVPIYELFKYHLDTYLAFDQFHPSGMGYEVIAQELYKILN